MYTAKVEVKNKTGLHARPAATFVKTANKFKSTITLEKEGKEANAKAILSVLTLGASMGSVVGITAEGEDEQLAVNTLVELIESKFGE